MNPNTHAKCQSGKGSRAGRAAILSAAVMLAVIASIGFGALYSGSADADGHMHGDIAFTEWTSASSLPTEDGSYYLATDVVLDYT